MSIQTPEDIFITAVIDLSGSMYASGLVQETLNGVNKLASEQAAEGRGWMSLTTFDNKVTSRYRAWGLADMPTITEADVEGHHGMTALYDAVGTAISDTDAWVRDNPWFDGKHLVAIVTDGHENCSWNYTAAQVRELKVTKEAHGWGFVFLGAGIDAWDQGRAFGMSKGQSVSLPGIASAVKDRFYTLGSSTTRYRSAKGTSFTWDGGEGGNAEDQTVQQSTSD